MFSYERGTPVQGELPKMSVRTVTFDKRASSTGEACWPRLDVESVDEGRSKKQAPLRPCEAFGVSCTGVCVCVCV